MKTSLKITVTGVVLLASALCLATVLPESSDLKTASAIVRPLDEGLDRWMDAHADQPSLLALNETEFATWATKQDEVTRAFVELQYGNANGKVNQSSLTFARELFKDKERLGKISNHPLFPYLLKEFSQTPGIAPVETEWAQNLLMTNGGRSCPKKDFVLKDLNAKSGHNMTVNDFESLLARITNFQSKTFRKEAMGSFLDTLPQKFQGDLRAKVFPLVVPFPEILEDNSWLVDEDDSSKYGTEEPFRSLRQAEDEARKDHCRTAKISMLRAAQADSDKVAFAKVEKVAEVIESCFRQKGSAAREKFWVQVEKGLTASYGFLGRELAQRNIGLLAWSRDDFTKARGIFESLIIDAKKENLPKVEGEAIFTLARIEENDSKLAKSLEYYDDYVTRFPESERYLEALEAMVLLYSLNSRLVESLNSAEKIILSQSKLDIDKQNTSSLSFALFWAGRLHYTIGNKSLAEEMWRRVASEYYSTFYGALGHYVLEKVKGKHLELEPSVGRRFNLDNLQSYFNKDDRSVIATIEALLRVGSHEDAACELNEIVIDDNGKEKILVKSLLQNAAGEWLSSIINFSNLPRSFRHSLPIGFERLLFPRAYVDPVSNYAERLKLDPDFVFAIIRQESVFNPKAMSGAGARGLMQLMPGTAKLESRRLGRSYLPLAKRSQLQRSVRSQSNLFDADTNLALGVHHVHTLLEKYGNPIFVLTSYNANPSATERWIANLPTRDYLAFIERIPYRETQAYVKLVLRNYFYYKRWYRPPTTALPHLDTLAQNMMKIAQAHHAANTPK